MSEDRWLAAARAAFPADGEAVVLPNGDDAAGLDPAWFAGRPMAVAKDVLVDGVHFDLRRHAPAAAAWKAVAVNVSDLAACGAEPVGFLVGGVLPRPASRPLFDALMTGFAQAARDFRMSCLGGDTNSADAPLMLSVTVLGRAMGGALLSRSRARVGDVLSVSGPLGGSLHQDRHLTPRPRLDVARWLVDTDVAHAVIDLSDGLARDLPRLLQPSGVGAEVDWDTLPVHDDVPRDGDRVQAALVDGEDFELLVAHAPLDAGHAQHLANAGLVLHPVGRVRAEPGIEVRGAPPGTTWPDGGYDHTRDL